MIELQKAINNKFLYIPLIVWFCIQIFKVIYDLITTKKLNFKRIMGAGGMPSSHSAVVTSLATLIGKYQGVDTPIFAMSVVCLRNGKYYDINNLNRILNVVKFPQKGFPITSKDNHLYIVDEESLVSLRDEISIEYSIEEADRDE